MQHDKLTQALCLLLAQEPWYGHAAMTMAWTASDSVETMGVRVIQGGEVECLYNPEFLTKLTVHELYAVVQHEIEHVVRCHCVRQDGHEPERWNVACDMVVNGVADQPRIGYRFMGADRPIIPLRDRLCWIPKRWPLNEPAEFYYQRMGTFASGTKFFLPRGHQTLDDHSVWSSCDTDLQSARAVAQHVADVATAACRGRYPRHLRRVIKRLSESSIPWQVLLRRYLDQAIKSRRVSYSRRNRRRDVFGMPGTCQNHRGRIVVIVDVSGSIRLRQREQFFGEVESICRTASVGVLLWDHSYKGYVPNYKSGQWREITFSRGGGTDMATPLRWLLEKRLCGDCVVMLTDGYCCWSERLPIPFIAAISTRAAGPTWGHTIRLPRTATQ